MRLGNPFAIDLNHEQKRRIRKTIAISKLWKVSGRKSIPTNPNPRNESSEVRNPRPIISSHGIANRLVHGIDKTSESNSEELGPVLEDSILEVLCSLGALHSTEFHVLLLPCDAVSLRHVVKSRYIGKILVFPFMIIS